jgi:hypothetical protein
VSRPSWRCAGWKLSAFAARLEQPDARRSSSHDALES